MMRRSFFYRCAARGANGKILIAYGSQTGTAETYARMLGTLAVHHNFTPIVCTMDDAVPLLANHVVERPKALLCVCSTYGTGEFPSNAQRFAQALEAGQLGNLKDLPYSVLGLGNSHNDNFNAAAKSVDKLFKQHGAKSIVRMQLSCEVTQGHDVNYRTWKRGVFGALDKAAGVKAGELTTLPLTYDCPVVLGALPDREVLPTGYARAFVNHNDRLSRANHEPHLNLLTLTVAPMEQIRKLNGRTATLTDNLQVMPRNNEELVARALKRLNIPRADIVVEITPLPGATASFVNHRKMRIDTVLSRVVDLSAVPTRSFLESLAVAATDPTDKARIDDLANDLSANSEYDKLTKGIFSVMDCLEMFPNVPVTLAYLLSHAPHIQPRSYSIARDNSDWKNDEFEIVYGVPVRHAGDKVHRGLASSMLENLKTGDSLMVKFDPSPTRVLPAHHRPLCIVALGSGIGAARALLQRRRIALRANSIRPAPAVLYYGFRKTGEDDLFGAELAELEKEGVVQVRKVASHDVEGKFITPMDTMDRSLGDFLANEGEVVYCGMGGSVPLLVEAALRTNGVDVAAMRASGRYHEEYFTTDPDVENLLKVQAHNTQASTLSGRMGNCNMFCMQCEQTFRGTGCHSVGVCGKTPRVAALQDLTVHACKVLAVHLHALRTAGAAEDHEANRLTLHALFSTLTNVNFAEDRFVTILGDLQKATSRAADACKSYKVTATLPQGTTTLPLNGPLPKLDELIALGRGVGVLTRFTDPETQSQACVAEMLTYGLKGLAAYTDHSLMNNMEDKEIYGFMHKALAFLADPAKWSNLGEGLGLCLECGKVNVNSMALLYKSNSSLGVPSPHVAPVKPTPGKCILVSGHDLIMLNKLLPAAAKHGIKVYTHGEMLPAHAYPKLRDTFPGTLAGHYGGAWMRQSLEFPKFPGAILMTTNCLTEPHESYGDHLFTAGAVGWTGVKHIGNTVEDLDVEPLIKKALAMPGFTAQDTAFAYPDPVGQTRPASLTVGFGHETILGAAPTIIDQIKKGNITRFFLIGGCDGFEGQRSYYTDLVNNLPPTAVVLTLGCGKFRLNHLAEKLGTIGDTGIPRVLDMGQCNDSYSAVQVAVALAGALNCKVGDLPLSIVLSWFEQKAVAVLLSCLHLGLKPIHIGPTLPAFVTPAVLDVLVNQFGVVPIGNGAEDAKKMCAASAAS